MRRSALRVYLQRLVAASLPLFAGCNDDALSLGADAAVDAGADLCESRCGCNYTGRFQMTFNLPASELPDGGADCLELCNHRAPLGAFQGGTSCEPYAVQGETITVTCNYFHPCGRRPAGLRAVAATGNAVGAHLAQSAHLEAASVIAFERLARELAAHGAPPSLVRGAVRAANDEIRHARIMARLARRHGASVPAVEVVPEQSRSLFALAVENAREGCAGESFGATVALWQAGAAVDRAIGRAMGAIASDELRHAELAWAIDGWARSRLGARQRRRVDEERGAALTALEANAAADPDVQRVAGVPNAPATRALVDGLRRWRG